MQNVDDLLRRNLDAFGERNAERRHVAISALWKSSGVFVDPDGLHIWIPSHRRGHRAALAKVSGFRFQQARRTRRNRKADMGFGRAGEKPAVTGLDVIVSRAGKIEALYTFLDPAER